MLSNFIGSIKPDGGKGCAGLKVFISSHVLRSASGNLLSPIKRFIYIYNPKKHSISEIDNYVQLERLKAALPTLEHETDQSAFIIFLVSDLAKMTFKYQERAYRFALLECGHIAENLLLCATSLKLKSFPVGAYMDDEVNFLLNLDGVTSNIQYILFFGT